MNKEDALLILENKRLIEKYPFLIPRNRWNDKIDEDYDYTYTELDAMPIGWKKAFGELICEDIKNELEKIGELENYRIHQIKEKYGSLRWYDNGHTEAIRDILFKYEYISEKICIKCGKWDVSLFDDGWVCPWCDDCFVDYRNRRDKLRRKNEKIELSKEDIEDLKKYRLEDEPFNPIIKIESMGKNGCSWRELDVSDILKRMGIEGY